MNVSAAVSVVFAAILVGLGFGFLLAWPVMALWNGCLVDAVSGVKEITWLQAWGLMALCSLLFKTEAKVSKS